MILTAKEQQVIDALVELLEPWTFDEPGYSNVFTDTLADETELPIKELRGVMASLVKKDLIYVYDGHGEDIGNTIHLTDTAVKEYCVDKTQV